MTKEKKLNWAMGVSLIIFGVVVIWLLYSPKQTQESSLATSEASLKELYEAPSLLTDLIDSLYYYKKLNGTTDSYYTEKLTKEDKVSTPSHSEDALMPVSLAQLSNKGFLSSHTAEEIKVLTHCDNLAGITADLSEDNSIDFMIDKEVCSNPPGTENDDAIVLSDDGSRLSITLGESHE